MDHARLAAEFYAKKNANSDIIQLMIGLKSKLAVLGLLSLMVLLFACGSDDNQAVIVSEEPVEEEMAEDTGEMDEPTDPDSDDDMDSDDDSDSDTDDPSGFDISGKVLLWLDASNHGALALEGELVSGWQSEIGDVMALPQAERMVFDAENDQVIGFFNGVLGVEDLGQNVTAFLLVGTIIESDIYSTILGNSLIDFGDASRYLLRQANTERFGSMPEGYFNGGTEKVNPDAADLPGNDGRHLFYAETDDKDLSNAFFLGSSGNGQNGQFGYHEVIAFHTPLTPEELDQVVTELLEKWAISTSN